jgi:hypothetical protein
MCFYGRTLLFTIVLLAALHCRAQQPVQRSVTSVREADAVCARCHEQEYRSYLTTSMATASGLAKDHLIPGEFHQPLAGIVYSVSLDNGLPWLTYRSGNDQGVRGKQELQYFLGSGHLGVTYMYTINGYLVESPVAYYSALKAYDLKPGLANLPAMPAALPMSSQCMRCHMSEVRNADPGSLNHYRDLPFLHGGITCEQCHGETKDHVLSQGKAPLLSFSKLDADRRDSICISCHLEGDTSVEHSGRSIANYKPGDRIEDYVSYFVYRGANPSGRGVSEVEQLASSKCKRTSGDRMSCMSCHDPHRKPSAEERASFYRSKCLACHREQKFTTSHFPENRDCTSCHMPASGAENIPHVAWTDHRIPIPSKQLQMTGLQAVRPELIAALPQQTPAPRELALAYANLVMDGKKVETDRAWSSLLAVQSSNPQDPDILVALGYVAESMGAHPAAADYYRRALQYDPSNLSAMNNLGTLLAREGKIAAAAELWTQAFQLNEDIESLGLNLAIAYCREGLRDKTEQVLRRVLVYSPGSVAANRKLRLIEAGQESCGPMH